MFDFVQSVKYRIRCSHYFRNALRDSDAVIIACGMFNYSVQTHMYPEEINVCQARKRHIPVLLSAMSVENVVEWNSGYERLVRICNDPAVTMFTSRDGANGVERIKSQYLKQKIYVLTLSEILDCGALMYMASIGMRRINALA